MIDIAKNRRRFLRGPKLQKIANACRAFWSRVESWLQTVLEQKNIEKCHPLMLEIHGWGRRVGHFPAEPLDMYRLRVLYAYRNAADAGSRKGLEEILRRLGIKRFSIAEREEGKHPDICSIRLQEGESTANTELLIRIVQEYGLTCRRYSRTVADFCRSYRIAAEYGHLHRTDFVATDAHTTTDTDTLFSHAATAGFSGSAQTTILRG